MSEPFDERATGAHWISEEEWRRSAPWCAAWEDGWRAAQWAKGNDVPEPPDGTDASGWTEGYLDGLRSRDEDLEERAPGPPDDDTQSP